MIHPADSPLYQTPESLNRVRVRRANNIDASRVIDAAMLIPVDFVQSFVGWPFICVDDRAGKDVLLGESVESGFSCAPQDTRATTLPPRSTAPTTQALRLSAAGRPRLAP